MEIKARSGVPKELDQSDNIRDLILRERERARYEVGRNPVIKEKATYGSGFSRMYFETVYDDRVTQTPVFEPIDVFNPGSLMRHMAGKPQLLGYQPIVEKKVIFRGCRFEFISIWDIFPDPKALRVEGNIIAHRYETEYGEILKGIEEGYYIQEARLALSDLPSDEQVPEDKKVVESDRQIADSNISRTKYNSRLRCYELFARLPKKWVYINGEEIDDPEKLVPAVIRFHKRSIVSVALNDSYDGEAQIFKDDYMPVPGQFYGMGICEMLKDVQEIGTEIVNQRLDTGAIALRQRFGIIEKALVDPKDIDENRDVVRLKNPSGFNDIRQMMMRLDMGSVPGWAFMEPQEWERMAQERTSIGRQTLGTAGQVKDANQTLGGMEMLKAATGDKMAYIGMLSEFDYQTRINHAFWKFIYQNYQPEDYVLAIGQERAATIIPMSPEEVERNYQYYPTGVYTMENKALRTARLAQIDQQFGMMPWFNRVEIARAELHAGDEDPEKYILQEAEAMQIIIKAQDMAAGMAQQLAQEKPEPSKEAKA